MKRSLIIQASNKCSCYCPGCYNFFSDNTLSSISIKEFVEKYINIFHPQKVTLSGGDPLLRQDIFKLIKMLKELNINLSLDSVGDALLDKFSSEQIEEMLNQLDILGIPLDGVDTETIQYFRQGCTFDKTIEVIKKATKYHSNICINTVIHAKNKEQVQEMLSIINDFKEIKQWQIFQFMPIGPRGYLNKEKYFISTDEFKKIQKEIKQLKKREELEIQCKSIESRKNNYLILACNGEIWAPKQTVGYDWKIEDNNRERIIIGSIFDAQIFDKILQINSCN